MRLLISPLAEQYLEKIGDYIAQYNQQPRLVSRSSCKSSVKCSAPIL
jgi:plasmid stabilization system protein ParE